jgi:hypothetical protein
MPPKAEKKKAAKKEGPSKAGATRARWPGATRACLTRASPAGDVSIQLRAAAAIYKASCKQSGAAPQAHLLQQLQECADAGMALAKIVLRGVDDAALQSVLEILSGYAGVRALHCWECSISDQAGCSGAGSCCARASAACAQLLTCVVAVGDAGASSFPLTCDPWRLHRRAWKPSPTT